MPTVNLVVKNLAALDEKGWETAVSDLVEEVNDSDSVVSVALTLAMLAQGASAVECNWYHVGVLLKVGLVTVEPG